ncbi:YheU family protein [Parashewanella spongiae]|uniref:YheU family protein n=1 Tax=Parashewanella spongiae TaxID=342950 RepID=A0A3A6TJA5_9GAMM|nr:YheU family protein [Parashewanella spongiae]MCL1079533.1 YheU family protein [Parashewanella spongiae]RJY07357.1 YheU family protein [Parashewanella spongiae]
MLVPYDALSDLPTETLDNLVKEYLFTQVEDGSFTTMNNEQINSAIEQCKKMLKQGILVVEYSENDESIGIRHIDQINGLKNNVS